MLTGEWGSGKSYYIKNTLKPFLEDKNNGKHNAVADEKYAGHCGFSFLGCRKMPCFADLCGVVFSYYLFDR